MSKPDPAITADLLSKLPSKKTDPQKGTLPGKKDHTTQRGPLPQMPKVNSRSAEKASGGQGHTRTSNRGK